MAAVVHLEKGWYHAVWRLVLLLHLGHAIGSAYLVKAMLQTIISTELFGKMLRLTGTGLAVRVEVYVTATGLSMAYTVWHTQALARMLHASIRRRACVWSIDDESQSADKDAAPTTLWSRVRSLVSVHSPHYNTVYSVRKIIELASQSYQALRMSWFMTHRGIHLFAVVVLVFNCCAAPYVRLVSKHNEMTKRLLRLVANVVASSCFTFVLPYIVFGTYRFQRDAWAWHNPLWLASISGLLVQVLINSWSTFIIIFLPQFLVPMALENIKSVARNRHSANYVAPPDTTAPGATPTPVTHTNPRRMAFLSMLYGLFIVVCHLVANLSTSSVTSMCIVRSYPWFYAGHVSCVVAEVNCYHLQIDGNANQIDVLLANFEPSILQALTFAHCPQLEMPPRLQTLEYLIYLEIFNSTIKQWNASAAVVSTHQPRLANIVLVLVSNITSLPVGLTQPQMPAYAVEICGSDLEKLPVDIASKWSPRLDVLYIERSQLSTFPRAVLDFSVIANVSLALNNVSVLPRELFAMNSTSFLTLSGNPITAIPDDCAAPSHVAMLDVRNTSISSLTRCVGSAFIDGAGSPLCVNGGVGTINESKQQLSCGNGGREMTMFPLAELVVARAP